MSEYFIFGDIDTRNFTGITVSFDKVDNTPSRVYTTVEVPGRNGSLYIDEGRYENVPHVYHIAALTKQNGSDLINALASKTGYYRLSDSFNTGEFYSAVFTSSVEPKMSSTRDVNTFKLTFTRKPQRFLTSGETKSSVANNGTVTNPTKFDASPLLECKGYGTINIGGGAITVASVPIGNVMLADAKTVDITNATDSRGTAVEIARSTIDVSKLNTGDSIYVDASSVTYNVLLLHGYTCNSTTVSGETGESWTTTTAITSSNTAYWRTAIAPQTFVKGTSATKTYEYILYYVYDTYSSLQTGIKIQIQYDGNQTVKLLASTEENGTEIWEVVGVLGQINGYSSKTITDTLNIDLDIGEAYYVNGSTITNANYAVKLPARLPKLASGNNTITYSNTITNFKVTPRWWKA